MSLHRGSSLLRCHFCGKKLSLAQAMELHEGEGYFYVCEHCAISLDPLRLKQSLCYRCAAEGHTIKSILMCDICGKGVCGGHHVEMQPEKEETMNRRVSRYEPALFVAGSKRRILCDVCATALGEDEEG